MARLMTGKLFQDENLKKSTTDMFMVLTDPSLMLLPLGHSLYRELEPPPEFR